MGQEKWEHSYYYETFQCILQLKVNLLGISSVNLLGFSDIIILFIWAHSHKACQIRCSKKHLGSAYNSESCLFCLNGQKIYFQKYILLTPKCHRHIVIYLDDWATPSPSHIEYVELLHLLLVVADHPIPLPQPTSSGEHGRPKNYGPQS